MVSVFCVNSFVKDVECSWEWLIIPKYHATTSPSSTCMLHWVVVSDPSTVQVSAPNSQLSKQQKSCVSNFAAWCTFLPFLLTLFLDMIVVFMRLFGIWWCVTILDSIFSALLPLLLLFVIFVLECKCVSTLPFSLRSNHNSLGSLVR